MLIRRALIMSCGLFVTLGAQSHESAVSRYRVAPLAPPSTLQSGCLPGYGVNSAATRINDFGIANGSFTCYTTVDTTTPLLLQQGRGFFGAPWFGAVELSGSPPGFNYAATINNRGELFGYESPADVGGLYATKWTVSGGRQGLFVDPSCDTIQIAMAVDGNARFTVGWAFRKDPSFPVPYDFLCLTTRWVIRDAAGVESTLPITGTPAAINAFDVVAGTQERSAIRYHVPTGTLRLLHAADSAHSVDVADINDLGEVVGRIVTNSTPDTSSTCDPGVAVRWDKDGREHVLPHLPGAVASHAFGVGYDGEVVGDSGAGRYCPYNDNGGERAVLWKGGRVYDLNSLIPRGSGVTLTYAYGVNRRGQITAAGFDNDEPSVLCPSYQFDPINQATTIVNVPCRNVHMFVLTPVGR